MSDKDKQKLNTLLYQLFQITGSFTDTKQLDRLRTVSAQLSTALQEQARGESVELMRKLQKAVVKGFKKTFTANAELEKRIVDLEEKLNDTLSNRSNQRANLKDVSADTKPQSAD